MIHSLAALGFVVAWLLPGHYFPWTSFQQEVAAAVAALLLALAVLVSPNVRRQLPVSWLAIGAIGLAVVPWVQWGFGRIGFFADALLASTYLCAFGLTVVAARSMVIAEGERFVASIFAAILVAALASVGIGLVQWLAIGPVAFIENLPRGDRVFANFTQPNQFACLLGLAIAPLIWLFERRHIGAATALLALAVMAWGLVMTQSRAALAIVVMYLAWWAVGRTRVPLRTSFAGVVSAFAVLVAVIALWGPINGLLDSGSSSSVVQRTHSAGTRAIHWPALWDAAWRQPWFGWGWMQVSAAQQAVALDHPASHEWITYSHNIVLDLLVWNGLLVGGAVVVALGAWFILKLKATRDASSWALLGAAGTIVVYAQLEFPHAYAFFLLPLAVFAGGVEGLQSAANDAAPTTIHKRWFAALCGLLAVVLTLICLDFVEVEEASRRASMHEAGYITPGESPKLPATRLLDNQREFVWFRLTPAQPGMTAADLERMRRVNQRYMPPAVLLRYALATGLNGQPDVAARNLALICSMWSPKQCDQGRESWRQLQQRYPQLGAINFPPAAARR